MSPPSEIQRIPRRNPVQRVPAAVAGEPGLFTVDATWGKIQPLRLPGGVETVAELDVIDHIRSGGPLVDCRQPESVAQGTLPAAVAIPHQEITDELRDEDPAGPPIVIFCNGPQCTASAQAIAELLRAGWDPARLRYYRGGVHDWVTLGLPLATPGGIS